MKLFDPFAILSSGMAAQRTRLDVIASNLANAHTTRTPQGGPYRRMEPVFVATPVGDDSGGFGDALDAQLRGVNVARIARDPRPLQRVYDPGHPDADADGFVTLPNVNPVEEMVDLIAASRSFEANAEAFQTVRQMFLRALELGR